MHDNAPICLQTPDLEKSEKHAIRACFDGVADAGQQRQALTTIVQKLCRTNDLKYIPGQSDRDTAFLNGRSYPGLLIIDICENREEDRHD